MRAPVRQKPRRRRRHAPVGGVWQRAPARDMVADFVDDRGRVVFLFAGSAIVPVAKRQRALARPPVCIRGMGTGVMISDRRRPSTGGTSSGWPYSSSA